MEHLKFHKSHLNPLEIHLPLGAVYSVNGPARQFYIEENWFCKMSSTEQVEIVASFPLPPKQFYEKLSEEEILQLEPPEIPKGTLKTFGFDQVTSNLPF